MTKAELRKCEPLEAVYAAEASKRIERFVTELPEYRKAGCVFVYVSAENEPQTRGIIGLALNSGKRVCVPVCTGRAQMKAVQIKDFACLHKGAFGIYEPENGEIVSEAEIELALIPCVCSDRYGNRLGHGAGYYDRYLKRCKAYRVCLCFESRLAQHIPADENDVPMHCVITENGVIRCTEVKHER